jgi:hypothetical protein
MRTLFSLVFLAAILWASCTVKLGSFTLAEHVDRIGETEQARELLDGTRGRIAPVLEDMKQRVLGEYVEAPTRTGKDAPTRAGKDAPAATKRKPPRAAEAAVPARVVGPAEAARSAPKPPPGPSREPSSAEAARLPGAGRRAAQRREGA